ncbi:hypothetical protein [Streptomyces sp. NPDC005953]|uniref:hypothetical protein n=1 Tax=Streptomyces sp. NPDC005953 TaxID=3156719 RepID=UPI0033CF857F
MPPPPHAAPDRRLPLEHAVPHRTDYLPHCTTCANDMTRAQQWNDLMNARYGN